MLSAARCAAQIITRKQRDQQHVQRMLQAKLAAMQREQQAAAAALPAIQE